MAYVKKTDRAPAVSTTIAPPTSVALLGTIVSPEAMTYVDQLLRLYSTIALAGAPRRTLQGHYQGMLELGMSNRIKFPHLIDSLVAITLNPNATLEHVIEAEHVLVAHGFTQIGGTI